jgi:hypothetical protein
MVSYMVATAPVRRRLIKTVAGCGRGRRQYGARRNDYPMTYWTLSVVTNDKIYARDEREAENETGG